MAEKSLRMGAKFYSFDIRTCSAKFLLDIEKFNAVILNEDVMQSKLIIEVIKSNKRVLVLNDGIKIPALKKLSPFLKHGDCIFTHDYGEEWQFSDIKDCMRTNNLERIQCDFEEYLWFCCIKKV